jgi:mannose-6-phosphate isomerase-like protein (cupin superfamily)
VKKKSKPKAAAVLARVAEKGAWLEVTPGESFTVRVTSEDTKGGYTVIEIVAQPRNGVVRHIHHKEEEHFIVVEGTLHMARGDDVFDVPAGSSVSIPRGVPHAWCNLGEIHVRFLVLFTPGGVEEMFHEIAGGQTGDPTALLGKYNCEIVGPPMVEGLYGLSSPRA